MANTTFNGPVRSENGFESIVKNTSTGVVTKLADLHAVTGGNSVVADAATKAGALLLSSIATIGCVMQTYQATVTVANGATTGPITLNSSGTHTVDIKFGPINSSSLGNQGNNILIRFGVASGKSVTAFSTS